MSLESKPVLHYICTGTLLSAAIFVSIQSSFSIWKEYVEIWVNPCVEHLKDIHADLGPQVRSEEWQSYINIRSIMLLTSGVGSHHALGVCERHYEYLLHVCCRVRADYKNVRLEYVLRLSIYGMNAAAEKRFKPVPTYIRYFSNVEHQCKSVTRT